MNIPSHIIRVISLLIYPAVLCGQTIIGGFGGFIGYKNVEGMTWRTFDEFTNSYNIENIHLLDKPLDPLRLTNGMVWGLEANFMAVGLGFNHLSTSAFSNAKLKNGESRELELNAYQNEFTFDFVYPIGVYANIGVMTGMSMEGGTLKSRYIYKNGLVSYAGDKDLNGEFNMRSTGSMIFGFRADIGYKWVKLSFRAENYNTFFIGEGSSYLNLKDPLGWKVAGYSFVDGDVTKGLSPYDFFRGWTYMIVLRLTYVVIDD